MTQGDAVMTCEEWESKHSSDKAYQLGTVVQVKKVKLPKEHADGESGNAFIQQCQEKKSKDSPLQKKTWRNSNVSTCLFCLLFLLFPFFVFFDIEIAPTSYGSSNRMVAKF